jgi:hypothetical protein
MSYCVRIRAYSDSDVQHNPIYGNFTYLSNAFTFAGYGACPCAPSVGDAYNSPIDSHRETWTPLFTWKPIIGAAGYWIIVSKDRSFTTIVDYAFTRIPAYAPRLPQSPSLSPQPTWTYTDEETQLPYYWAILPTDVDGRAAAADPNFVGPANFVKRSIPPTVLHPGEDGTRILGPPTFQWTPVPNAKIYELQVSQDRNFGTLVDDLDTDSTAYTATKTYPANAALYFRVRAKDNNDIGLAWSASRRFRDALATPTLVGSNAVSGDLIPTWVWKHVQGALSYDIHVDLPNGTDRDFSDDLLTAFTATKMTGTGVFRWQVRAEFPEARGGKTAVGPYTRAISFTRTIRPPHGASAAVGGRSILLSWQPKIGAEHYLVQVATSPDFGHTIENTRTDNTSFAPDLRNSLWSRGATFYWRVAAVDADNNSGNYTPVRRFRLHLPRSR